MLAQLGCVIHLCSAHSVTPFEPHMHAHTLLRHSNACTVPSIHHWCKPCHDATLRQATGICHSVSVQPANNGPCPMLVYGSRIDSRILISSLALRPQDQGAQQETAVHPWAIYKHEGTGPATCQVANSPRCLSGQALLPHAGHKTV
jgi:hypothetical protein